MVNTEIVRCMRRLVRWQWVFVGHPQRTARLDEAQTSTAHLCERASAGEACTRLCHPTILQAIEMKLGATHASSAQAPLEAWHRGSRTALALVSGSIAGSRANPTRTSFRHCWNWRGASTPAPHSESASKHSTAALTLARWRSTNESRQSISVCWMGSGGFQPAGAGSFNPSARRRHWRDVRPKPSKFAISGSLSASAAASSRSARWVASCAQITVGRPRRYAKQRPGPEILVRQGRRPAAAHSTRALSCCVHACICATRACTRSWARTNTGHSHAMPTAHARENSRGM